MLTWLTWPHDLICYIFNHNLYHTEKFHTWKNSSAVATTEMVMCDRLNELINLLYCTGATFYLLLLQKSADEFV